ncbi:hypothetical protein AMATHDRAFT_7978 [Amanita thiersii Skay4041]|uniref:Cyclin-like domain-containing protein n=1 Tax=Amanita thiersii Skay4041 TaxID=703135 RepID=A0A2A9NDJ4_9AGAR|nr:hypothetical protein AMATHDRAFT_7978 [Amanita thiersii Skay4041]
MGAIHNSPLHPASLVDSTTHSPAILELIDIKISRQVIDYLVDSVIECVDYALGKPTPSRGRPLARRPEYSKFTTFVSNVISRAEITTSTLLATLVYIDRAKPHLHIALEEWALERVFLGALIVASKYLNDSTLKNVHWALCTGVFGKRDVGRIEREYLDVLDFELGVTEDDILSHHQGLMSIALGIRRNSNALVDPLRPSHKPHVRNHNRRCPAVPELEPSSPESSSTSSYSSPQTPSTTDSSPSHPPSQKSSQPQSVQKKSIPSTTMDLLRSFPLPTNHQSQSSWSQSQFPIQIS